MVNQPKSLNLLVAAMGILSVVSLAGCQQAVPSSERFASAQGVNVEAFMPADTFMFAKIGTNDQSQIDTLKVLNGYFPGNPVGQAIAQFNTGFKEGAELEKVGLTYEKDILPLINEKTQFFIGISPRAGDADNKANFHVAMTVADTAKFDEILGKQVQANALKKEDYNGQTIYSEAESTGTPAFMTRYMDTVLLATSSETLKAGLDNVKANKDLFAENADFKKAMGMYKPNIAVIYANLPQVIAVLGEVDGANSAEMAKALAGTDAANIQSEVLMVTAEKEGIRIAAKVFGKDGTDLTKGKMAMNMPVYLMKKIPAVNPILYFEGSGLKASYETMLQTLNADPEFTKSMQEMKDFLASYQLDFEKDIMSFMDKGVAFVFDDTGTAIPSIGFYLDASSNPEGAAKVADRINKGFESALADAEKESPDIKMVISKQEVTPGKLWKFKLNLDILLTQVPSAIAQKLSGQKVELYYGLLDENILVLALKPDLEKVYGKDQTVEKSGEFSKALKFVGGQHGGAFYMAPAQVISLADTYIKMLQDSTGQASIPEYDAVKADITPLKSMIFSGGKVEKDNVTAEFFLHIAQ